jgi:hypothetical protein
VVDPSSRTGTARNLLGARPLEPEFPQSSNERLVSTVRDVCRVIGPERRPIGRLIR